MADRRVRHPGRGRSRRAGLAAALLVLVAGGVAAQTGSGWGTPTGAGSMAPGGQVQGQGQGQGLTAPAAGTSAGGRGAAATGTAGTEASTGPAWRITPSVRGSVTATSNSGISDRQALGRDVVVETSPKVEVRHQGGGLKVDGNLEAVGLTYLQRTQPNRLLPKGSLRARAEAVDNWLWLEALAAIDQTNANPFAARGDGGSAFNTLDTFQWRLAPVIQRALSPTLSLNAHLGLEATQRRGDYATSDPRRDQRRREALFRLESLPRPFGGSIEATDDETRFVNEVNPLLRLTEARAVGTWQVDPSLTLGAVAGWGRTRFLLTGRTETFGGARLQWTPQERTGLKLSAERRFFGTAFDLELSHRNPFFAAYLNLQRQPSTQPTSLLLSPGGDVAGLLDAIFTTRFPNPIERAAVVQGVLDGLGRPSSLSRPVEVFSDYAQLQTRANVAFVVQGRRTTATLRWITLEARQLAQADTPFVPTPGFGADTRQRLASFDVSHRLASDLSVDFSLAAGRIEGLGLIDGSATEERIARLALTWAVNPNLDLSAGLRRQLVSSTVQPSAAEWALILGALYRH